MSQEEELLNLRKQLTGIVLLSTCLFQQLDTLQDCVVKGKPFARQKLKYYIKGLLKELGVVVDDQKAFYDEETVKITGNNLEVLDRYSGVFTKGDLVKLEKMLDFYDTL